VEELNAIYRDLNFLNFLANIDNVSDDYTEDDSYFEEN
jgi:hypothetical protein